MYAKDISNKIKSVKHNKQNLGLFIGGKAPFGYKLNKKIPNKLFVDLEAKPIIQRIFYEASCGNSCRNIAYNLNLDKVPTPSQYALSHGQKIARKSTTWSDSRIREILLNEVYIGNMVQGRMKKVNYKSKKNTRLPKKEWKVVKNTHEPLIDLNTFQKATEMINLRKQTRVKSLDYTIKGFVYCHECGKKMYCSSRHLASGNKYYFRCSTNTSGKNNKMCSPHSIRMEYVQELVLDNIKQIIIENYDQEILKDIIKQYINKLSKQNNLVNKIDFYNNQLSEITSDIDKLYSDKISRHYRRR